MKLITVHIPEPYIKALDELVELGLFPSRSEAIRVAIRDLIIKERNFMDKMGGTSNEKKE